MKCVLSAKSGQTEHRNLYIISECNSPILNLEIECHYRSLTPLPTSFNTLNSMIISGFSFYGGLIGGQELVFPEAKFRSCQAFSGL